MLRGYLAEIDPYVGAMKKNGKMSPHKVDVEVGTR